MHLFDHKVSIIGHKGRKSGVHPMRLSPRPIDEYGSRMFRLLYFTTVINFKGRCKKSALKRETKSNILKGIRMEDTFCKGTFKDKFWSCFPMKSNKNGCIFNINKFV